MAQKKIIALSGGFDPIHDAHIDLIKHAAQLGEVVIILNSDKWLLKEKGYVFMEYVRRACILRSIKYVKRVTPAEDSDGTVCEALSRLEPDMFGNGGPRTEENTQEKELCEKLGIELVWDLGYSHHDCSDQSLVELAFQNLKRLRSKSDE